MYPFGLVMTLFAYTLNIDCVLSRSGTEYGKQYPALQELSALWEELSGLIAELEIHVLGGQGA